MVRSLLGTLVALTSGALLILATAGTAEADVSTPVRALTAGNDFSCSVSADGSVHCWGRGGRLGDGTEVDRNTPNPVALLGPATTVEAGPHSTCALLVDGTVWCWGRTVLELADGTIGYDHLKPVPVLGVDGIVSLAIGDDFGCGLTATGSMRCWGSTFPVRHELDNVLALAAGHYHVCAVRTDGTAQCWGENGAGQIGDGTVGGTRSEPVDVTGLSGLVGIAAARDHTCAWDGAGSTWCWGLNSTGQLGTGDFDNKSTPTRVTVPTAVASMSLSQSHSCAVGVDGTAWCWGTNNHGELGDGSRSGRQTPTPVQDLGPAENIAAAGNFGFNNHSCAITDAGQPRCWGYNGTGALGFGGGTFEDVDRLLPTIPAGFDGRAVLGGLVTAQSQGVRDVQVDLFAATADGGRDGYLRSANTSDLGDGRFQFVVDPGCYVAVAIAPDGLVFTSGSPYKQWFRCTEAGDIRRDLDAALAEVGLEATIPVRVFATVDGQELATPGVTVDLFTNNARDERQYLGSVTTGPEGTASFEVEAGSYLLVFISPEGTVFTNNSRWVEAGVFVDVGETAAPIEAELANLVGEARIQALVNEPGRTPSVDVDLFQAGGDGLRAGYLESRTASPEASFPVRPGCYVIVFIAPDNSTFTNGSPWSEQPLCVSDGDTALVTATLVRRG